MKDDEIKEKQVGLGDNSCTAIVCAYNEELTLAGILNTLSDSPLVNDIVAIDDGSSDSTADVLKSFANNDKVHSIFLPQNQGKGYAMAEGVLRSEGDVLLFVDADLYNLDHIHIALMIHTLMDGDVGMVIGYPSRSSSLWWAMNPFRILSGERALYRTDILPLVDSMRNSRFGVETLINLTYRKEGRCVRHVPLLGLIHPIKLEKTGPTQALQMYSSEATQIAQTLVNHYPLALAAYGLDPAKPEYLWNQASESTHSVRRTLAGQITYNRARLSLNNWGEPTLPGKIDVQPDEKERNEASYTGHDAM